MKKILVISDLFNGAGGVEVLLEQFILENWIHKYDVSILVQNRDTNSVDEKFAPYVKGMIPVTFVRKRQKILAILKFLLKTRLRYDAVIAMKSGECMDTASIIPAKKRIGWVHFEFGKPLVHHLKFLRGSQLDCMNSMDHVVCVSEGVKDGVLRTVGDPGNLVVLYNPIKDKEIVQKAKEPVDDCPPKQDGVVRFVCVGRICRQKAQNALMDVCRRLNEEGYQSRYEVWMFGREEGQPFDLESIESVHQATAEFDNISYFGEKENVMPYIAGADWLLSTSRFEGMSLVSQEASVLNIPILQTETAGVQDLIEMGCPVKTMEFDEEDIYQKMKEVIEDPSVQKEMKAQMEAREIHDLYQERMDKIDALIEGK